MGKSEKLVVLSVLLVYVLLFVWSLQSDGGVKGGASDGTVLAGEPDSRDDPPITQRSERGKPTTEAAKKAGAAGAAAAPAGTSDSTPAEGPAGEAGQPTSPKMLLAETGVAPSVEIDMTRTRRTSNSSLADPAARGNGGSEGATTRTGLSRAQPKMQPGWDLMTTAGLQSTVDPAMFLYEVKSEEATWESLAEDLYGDEGKAALLRHNNEGMATPKGSIFIPAKDELGRDASVRTVEVLEGESLWQVAKRTLGKGSEWKAVYDANRDVITDPDFVAPGTILRIPVR